ncbi:hypothetical protein [Archangium sp.]|nr:hypothetical protein [Archangium sp.]HYO54604.1 hypothetical protein [Archangium sp.]
MRNPALSTKRIFETEIGWTTDSVNESVQASNITWPSILNGHPGRFDRLR